MEIDSLVISLGLDPDGLRTGLASAQTAIQAGLAQFEGFANGMQKGMEEAAQAIKADAKNAEIAAMEAADAGKQVGDSFETAGRRGGKGMDELANKTDTAAKKGGKANTKLQSLGNQWGKFLAGIAATFAAPIAGAISANAIFSVWGDEVAQVAQQTGKYTKEMEEQRKKREMLSRVTKEDIELYKKGREAMMNFEKSMADLSHSVVKALSPAIRGGIEKLSQFAQWIDSNRGNIIRFFTVLAGTITAVLLPAFIKMGAAMLMNPLTWIIAGIMALALVIDDLVTYIQGGESEFESFWAQFGTGQEILAKLKDVWDMVLTAFGKVKEYIPRLAKAAVVVVAFAGAFKAWKGISGLIGGVSMAFKAWKGISGLIGGIAGAFKALGALIIANPIGATVLLIATALGALIPVIIEHWDEIKAAFGKAGDWILEKWNKVIKWFADKFEWILEKWQALKDMMPDVGGMVDKGKEMAGQAWDKTKDTAASAWSATKDFFGFGDSKEEKKPAAQSEQPASIPAQANPVPQGISQTPPADSVVQAVRETPGAKAATYWTTQTPQAKTVDLQKSMQDAAQRAAQTIQAAKQQIPSGISLTQNSAPIETSIANSTSIQVDSDNHITVQVQTNADPNAIAGAVGKQMDKSANKLGHLAADGGVRQ